MGGITEKITEFIKEMLVGWVRANLTGMFTYLNEQVGNISGEVSKTPSTWNPSVFEMIQNLSENVIVPIAGMIISFVLCYELITMVMEKNNMHDFDTFLFFKYVGKACLAVWLVNHTFEIVMAVFDVGSHIIVSSSGVIVDSTNIDLEAALITVFEDLAEGIGIGELLKLGLITAIVCFCIWFMSVLITVILYGRMIEIYLYISVAPIPFATWTNREWGTIGSNYFKGLCALAIQGFFIMVCVGIYASLISSTVVDGTLNSSVVSFINYLVSVLTYTVLLCFSLFKTSSLAKSILNAH